MKLEIHRARSSRSPRRWVATSVALAVGALLSAFTRPASALETFPAIVQEKLGLACAPQCTLCHYSPNGGEATVRENAGWVVNLYFFKDALDVAFKDDSLPKILDALTTSNPCPRAEDPGAAAMTACDADGDGVTDIEEVKAGRDPNVAGPGNQAACPTYGCGAHIAPARPGSPVDGTAFVAALGVALVLVGRWRRG